MSDEWEQYRPRYAATRAETYDAYDDVWRRSTAARSQFTSWADFSQCANVEPARVWDQPERVAAAEAIMRACGYEIGPSTARGARRWFRRR